ncbi:hypothetical protein BJV82DRAFT_513956 [Fennellomyces sp. T-0311]|nr:hypothetical protein BJV82DRAFT_581905 [Fennellomyces sp. T-0311]KAI8144315.1 hypothetical protein BJV82DRAFT_513956 [Fennellomyces sp. T-0311]
MRQTLDMASILSLTGKSTVSKILGLAKRLDEANIPYDANIYECLLSAYSKADDIDQAMALFDHMRNNNVRPTVKFFHNALQLASQFADPKLQAWILEEMERVGYNPKMRPVYGHMLTCMRNNGEIERAFDTLERMRLEGVTPTLHMYRQLVDMCVQFNHPDMAYDMLKGAAILDTFAGRYNYMYMNLLRSAALNSSHEIVKDMWKIAVLDHNIAPDEGLCHYVLHVAAHYGDSSLGSDVIRVIGKLGYPYKESHFAPLIEAFAATGDWKSTLKVLHLMRAAGITPSQGTARPIAYKLGKDVEAIRLARDSLAQLKKEDSLDILAFNLIIHSFAYNNEYEDAMETFGRAAELGVTIDLETIHAILDACIHAEEAVMGAKIFDKYAHGNLSPNATTLSKMVTLMCTQDNYEDAFKYLEQMKSMGFVPLRGCYYRLVKKLASNQDSRLAIALDDMKTCGYDVTAYLQEHLDRHAPRY